MQIRKKSHRSNAMILLLMLLFSITGKAQVTLNANGPGDTYELINSVFAPGYDVIEAPDCSHQAFGRHIDEVFDDHLNKYVFRFHIHVSPDNDRCINFDRQRNEIKAYDKSPASLKAIEGETVLYEWKFKVDSFFQSSGSFTHLHQLKAVGGSEESMPLITFTTRKGTPDQLELRYARNTTQTTLEKVDLTPFKGTWVSVKEVVTYGESGRYSVTIQRVSDGKELLNYRNTNLRMWKTDASFIRPKWGIYRSLNDASRLRDEMLYFSDFSITEGDTSLALNTEDQNNPIQVFPNPAQHSIGFKPELDAHLTVEIYDQLGRKLLSEVSQSTINISHLPRGLCIVRLKENNQCKWISQFIKI